MKNLFKILTVIFVTSLIFISCSKDDKIESLVEIKKSYNQTYSKSNCNLIPNSEEEKILNDLGRLHNNSMEYAFSQINSGNLFSSVNEKEMDIIIRRITSEYYANFFNQIGYEADENSISEFLIGLNSKNNFSDQLQVIMDKYSELFYLAKNPQNFELIANRFYQNNISSLSCSYEKTAFKAAIIVGKSSFDYWYNNLDRWKKLYKNQNPRETNGSVDDIDYRDIAMADGVGAVVGGVKGAIAGTVVGSPVGGVIAGIFGAGVGAAEASLAAVGASLISWW